ncbi:tRNA dihydrouridine(20/20a) synthase DusA [Thiomicrospira sp. WB1]|uniref:tRNA dihydrouridine(20/20a) synthase DusA n=1 Tax=Thiomicrospira sp. WB1 TaxID=1685380 RepID=UPI0007467168|nr:tRNA dihydrouridine(20/20a) synthase DusA [Thiomicrospira sp. WB1]KUJ72031.1 tRNA-dihydrouridine synthase A [Thiomicrospira sp. WB1]
MPADSYRPIEQARNSAEAFSVAPMLDWTDAHCRVFHRVISDQAWLYTEMVTTGAILHGDNLPRFLGHDPTDAPCSLQLGGSDAKDLAQCARLGEEWGYQEIDLNVGCPSDRVQNNLIGACLMAHPKTVAQAVAEMKSAVQHIPITLKCRIGIDEQEDFDSFMAFVEPQIKAGVDGLIVHARKAWLQGLSPKENRTIPPLRYDWVRRLKQLYPDLPVAINGGIEGPISGLRFLSTDTERNLPRLDGVMIGRAVYEKPYLLNQLNDNAHKISRFDAVERMLPYIEQHLEKGGKLNQVTRHMLGLYAGLPGGRKWRRYLSERAFRPEAGLHTLLEARTLVENEIERMRDQYPDKTRRMLEEAS